jgi:hypothetical protein
MPGEQKPSHSSQRSLFFIVTILLLLSSGCGLDISFHENLSEIFSLSTNINQNIEFIAELSAPLQEDDSLALDLVDEIKGIPNNITRYNMTRMDDLHYYVIISVMVGSNVSYRYTKIGTITQSEVTIAGNAVRYRLFHVGESFQVKDIISGWTENDYPGLVGDLNGTILEKGSGDPIGDVLICIAGYQVLTDSLGKFSISNIPNGTHNFVTSAIDGSYEVFQQSIQINHDLDTKISIELTKLKDVSVKFIVNSPQSYENVPIRIAGNLYQFGNTFADLNGGINLLASRMPIMTELSGGKYSFEIKLHEGNDLHYVYTLGDGFWNTEQGFDDNKGYRQVIVPGEDTTIYDTIENWQNDAFQSLSFSLTIPENTPSDDIITIQFGTEYWFEPIPMVFAGNYQWNFSLLTPYPLSNNLNYRFCRNYSCDLSASATGIIVMEQSLTLGNKSVEVKISEWASWSPDNSPPTIYASDIPKKEDDYLAGIEFLPDDLPLYLESYLKILKDFKDKGITTIILHPSRSVEQSNNYSTFYLFPSSDLLIHDIIEINSMVESLDMNLILSPIFEGKSDLILISSYNSNNSLENMALKDQYKEIILSYAQLASNLNEEDYIIDLSFYGYSNPHESNSGIIFENLALQELPKLIGEVKSIYSGHVVCSLPLNYLGVFPSGLLSTCDALYFQIDLALFQPASFEEVKNHIGLIVDEKISPIHGANPKPVYIGFSAPSIAPEESNGLNLTDGKIMSPQNLRSFSGNVDLEYQALVYNAFMNEIIEREWIKGMVARSFYAPLKLTDASISINGKPAMDVLWYWYTGIK